MEFIYILAGLAAGAIVAFVFFSLTKNRKTAGGEGETGQSFVLLQNQMNELTRLLDDRMGHVREELKESSRFMQDSMRTQFSDSMKIVTDVTERLTKLDETNRQVMNFTDQLKDLQDILKNPKQRGILGEYYLETLLKNVLPVGNFEMQYKFADGDIVDAVVFVKDKIIPIDSKFSLENYNRIIQEKDQSEKEKFEKLFKTDLKNRIDETSKYIKPELGTMDFAFMFIPHEAIYYDLLIKDIGGVKVNTQDLIDYAFKKHVLIVSPTSFLAYLQTVMQGLKALQIEESAKEIRKNVGELGRHIASYDSFIQKMGGSLGTTVSHYNSAYKEFKKIDKDVFRIAGTAAGVEPLALEKPSLDSD